MGRANPFTPAAGAEPPALIGREDVLFDFEESLLAGVGAPARLMRIAGPRGSGKTVLLNELSEIARKHGWCVINSTAHQSWFDDLCQHVMQADLIGASAEVDFETVRASIKNSAGKIDVREVLDARVVPLTKMGKGLLVTVDEVQDASKDDFARVAIAVQHLIREKKNIAFAFAGTMSGVNGLLSNGGPEFMRRAYYEDLTSIPLDAVVDSLGKTMRKGGLEIEDKVLKRAAEATAGYAYLVQLVGYNIWRAVAMKRGELVATSEDVQAGIDRAMGEYERAVIETAIAGIGKNALRYLLAMAQDATAVSSTADIAARMGVPTSSLSSARAQLIDRQVIESPAHGYVAFSIPFAREYLNKNRSRLPARYGIEM